MGAINDDDGAMEIVPAMKDDRNYDSDHENYDSDDYT